ncbi:MAG: T9SS type A sorting domain-containing protein [Bacteroidota bacterium]
MKKITVLIIAFFLGLMCFAQLETREITHDDTTRKYLEYLPADYSGEDAFPVVFGLHGLGDNMNDFYNVGMNYIADTAGFILIVPEALEFTVFGQTLTAWNSGASMYGITPNVDVDDTGFLMAVLDSLNTHYNIDTEQVFFFGLSMGGYMCNKLACEKADRIDAIASVSGTMGVNYSPEPVDPIACLHIHGTNDETVSYTNNTSGMDADSLVNFWIAHNNNDTAAVVFSYPDTVDDGVSFERFVYPDGDKQVVHIKVINGEHNWYYTPQNDIDYAQEIWRFFKYRFPETEQNFIPVMSAGNFSIYPNPVTQHDIVNIKFEDNNVPQKLYLCNNHGQLVKTIPLNGQKEVNMNISTLSAGLYNIYTYPGKSQNKLIICR